jgi:hypothetical protein
MSQSVVVLITKRYFAYPAVGYNDPSWLGQLPPPLPPQPQQLRLAGHYVPSEDRLYHQRFANSLINLDPTNMGAITTSVYESGYHFSLH